MTVMILDGEEIPGYVTTVTSFQVNVDNQRSDHRWVESAFRCGNVHLAVRIVATSPNARVPWRRRRRSSTSIHSVTSKTRPSNMERGQVLFITVSSDSNTSIYKKMHACTCSRPYIPMGWSRSTDRWGDRGLGDKSCQLDEVACQGGGGHGDHDEVDHHDQHGQPGEEGRMEPIAGPLKQLKGFSSL